MKAPSRTTTTDGKKNFTVYHSGGVQKERGIAFFLDSRFEQSAIFSAVSDRIAILSLKCSQIDEVCIIGVYAPTDCSLGSEKDSFYSDLQTTLLSLPASSMKMVCGDLNAETGHLRSAWNHVLGPHRRGRLNDNGCRMLSFAAINGLFVGNSFFEHNDNHTLTWKSNDGRTQKLLDYILFPRNFRSTLENVKVNCVASIGSDHSMVCCKLKLHLRAPPKKRPVKLDYSVLLADGREQFELTLQNRFGALQDLPLDEYWSRMKGGIKSAVQEVCPRKKRQFKPWISQTTLKLVAERKLAIQAHKNAERNQLNRDIKASLLVDEETWLREKCDEMERAASMGHSRSLYSTLKVVAGDGKKCTRGHQLKDKTGLLIKSSSGRLRRWAEYFQDLLNRPDPTDTDDELTVAAENSSDADPNIDISPPVLAEVKLAIKRLKTGKAAGLDEVTAEALKGGGDTIAMALLRLIQMIWNQEEVPQDFKDGVIVPTFKKGDSSECRNYRGITLLSIAGKVLATIIKNRLNDSIERHLDEYQAGFRPGRSCLDQIFTLRQVQEKRCRYGKALVVIFVDFAAAFDSVHRESLWNCLVAAGIPHKIVSLLKSIYSGALSCVKAEGELSPQFAVKTGVRQGCILSPSLFNIVIEWVTRKARPDTGVQIGIDFWLWYLAYADDLAICADSIKDAQDILDGLDRAASMVGLVINAKKTKSLGAQNIWLRGEPIEEVEHFTYLGSTISANTISPTEDIRTRIGKATGSFARLRRIWRRDDISLDTKLKVYNSAVLSVLLYGSESWRVLKQDLQQLEVFQMSCLRRIAGISLLERRRNCDIRATCRNQPAIARLLQRNRLRWFGHVSRMDVNRLPAKAVFTPVPANWRCARNAPKRLWSSQIHDSLLHLKSTYGAANWCSHWLTIARDNARDRNQWRIVVQEAATLSPAGGRD